MHSCDHAVICYAMFLSCHDEFPYVIMFLFYCYCVLLLCYCYFFISYSITISRHHGLTRGEVTGGAFWADEETFCSGGLWWPVSLVAMVEGWVAAVVAMVEEWVVAAAAAEAAAAAAAVAVMITGA